MSYATAVAMLILVLSPVLIPLTITSVHAIADWRRNWRSARKITGPKNPAVTPAIDGRSITAQ
jgi:hypothetical protein